MWTFLHAPLRRIDTFSKCWEKRRKGKKKKGKEVLKDIFICCSFTKYFRCLWKKIKKKNRTVSYIPSPFIGCPIHSALCHIEAKSFVNYLISPHHLFWSSKMKGLNFLQHFLCIHAMKCSWLRSLSLLKMTLACEFISWPHSAFVNPR